MINDGKYKTLNKTLIYRGRIFDLEKHEIKLPDNNIVNYDIINHQDAVGILPIDNDNNVWFVRQFRPAIGDYLLEIPAGLIEEQEISSVTANRELQEEIGMRSNKLIFLGRVYSSPGFCTESIFLYLAKDMVPCKLKQDNDEFINIEKIKLQEVYDMVYSSRIRDSKILSSLCMAKPFLR